MALLDKEPKANDGDAMASIASYSLIICNALFAQHPAHLNLYRVTTFSETGIPILGNAT